MLPRHAFWCAQQLDLSPMHKRAPLKSSTSAHTHWETNLFQLLFKSHQFFIQLLDLFVNCEESQEVSESRTKQNCTYCPQPVCWLIQTPHPKLEQVLSAWIFQIFDAFLSFQLDWSLLLKTGCFSEKQLSFLTQFQARKRKNKPTWILSFYGHTQITNWKRGTRVLAAWKVWFFHSERKSENY